MEFTTSILTKLLSYFLVVVIVRVIIKKTSAEDKIDKAANEEVTYIRKNTYFKIYFLCAIVFGILYIVVSCFQDSGNEKNLAATMFIALSVLCFVVSLMYKRWYIRLEKDKIVYHNMLGKHITIDLNAVTHYKFNEYGEICLYQNETIVFKIFSKENKKILISFLTKNHIKERKQSKEFTIKAEPVQKWVIAILTAYLVPIGVICIKAKYLLGILFSLIMFSLSMGCCFQMFLGKIVFGTKEIVQYRFMRKPRRIPFSDIEKVEVRRVDNAECYDFILKNKKKLRINLSYTNTHLLEQLVKKRKWIK